MCRKLSCMVTDFLLYRGVIEEENVAIYQYGYEMLLNSVEQIVFLMILGAAWAKCVSTFIFCVVFISLRRYTGGYHASTRIGCMIVTLFGYFFVVKMTNISMHVQIPFIIYMMVGIICLAVVMRYTPIENINKRLSIDQIKISRRRAKIISIIYMVVALLLYRYIPVASYIIVYTMVDIVMLMIICKEGGKTYDGKEDDELDCQNRRENGRISG